MVHILDEINQEGCHIHNTADLRILLCQCVGVVVTPPALFHILRQWHKQSSGIPLLHQIPQVYQSRHSAVAVKPGMQVGNVEVDERRFQQIVHGGFLVDKLDQPVHILRQHLPREAGVLHFVTHNIHAVMAVFMAGQELILLW